MKEIIPVCPCPWCKKTPKLIFPTGWSNPNSSGTLTPYLSCDHYSACQVGPKSKHVSIRKSTKKDPVRLKAKIVQLIDSWNINNPVPAKEGMVFDFHEMIEQIQRDEKKPR